MRNTSNVSLGCTEQIVLDKQNTRRANYSKPLILHPLAVFFVGNLAGMLDSWALTKSI